jgi:hypothetical protein
MQGTARGSGRGSDRAGSRRGGAACAPARPLVELAQEAWIVVRRQRGAPAPARPGIAGRKDQPEHAADDRQDEHDDQPQPLRQGPGLPARVRTTSTANEMYRATRTITPRTRSTLASLPRPTGYPSLTRSRSGCPSRCGPGRGQDDVKTQDPEGASGPADDRAIAAGCHGGVSNSRAKARLVSSSYAPDLRELHRPGPCISRLGSGSHGQCPGLAGDRSMRTVVG